MKITFICTLFVYIPETSFNFRSQLIRVLISDFCARMQVCVMVAEVSQGVSKST